MSTIRVNAIQSTSTTDGGISIDNSGHVTLDGQSLPSAGPLSNRNLIINGAMQVAQRGTQETGVTTSGVPQTCDRFHVWIGTLGTWTIDQSTDAPDGFSSSLKATCTTADASPTGTDYAYFSHRIEAQNLQHLNYGSSAAQQLTLSFWVKSNKTGNATVALLQRDNSNKLLSPQYTISSADTWEYKTISIAADTSGVINNDNGIGLELEFVFNAGSSYSGGSHQTTWTAYNNANRYPSLLGVGGATSDYFAITGVQLEVGSVATPFEHRSFGDELARCQRYYQKSYNYAEAPGSTSTLNTEWLTLPTSGRIANTTTLKAPMRATATIKLYDWAGSIDRVRTSSGNGQTTFSIQIAGDSAFTVDTNPTSVTELLYHYTATAEL